jgi:hypothetical protein
MKKQYYSPSVEVVNIQNCTPLCASTHEPLTVGTEDQTGEGQLSNGFEGGIIDESAEF